jgi:transcription elongation GreA/GreB family factor
VNELALLTRILQRAITTDQLAPEHPGIVELGDEVAVEFANGYTQRLLVVSPIEAPLDDLNISVESPLGQALALLQLGHALAVRSERESFITLGLCPTPCCWLRWPGRLQSSC